MRKHTTRWFALAVGIALFAPLTSIPNASADVVADVRADADWLLKAVSADGGIGTWIDRAWLVPYRSNFAAMGLARATAITKDARYVAAAWRWLDWYQAHMGSNGFVTDYQWKSGGWVSTGDMDSTDAYASTFLSAIQHAFQASGDLARLSGLRTGITKALGAMEATRDSDGLHFAKPTWPFKYVMDEAENYQGLLAAAELANILGDSSLRDRASTAAQRLKSAFTTFWNAPTAAYDWAIHANGTRSHVVWSELYASSVAQAWAVAFGLVEGAAASSLFARFESAQPNWDKPTARTQYPWGPGKVDYWPVGGLAAARAGKPDRAKAAAASIRNAALAANRYWPFTTAEAGELILLSTDGIKTTTPAYTPVATTMTAASPPSIGATLREAASGRGIAGARVDFFSLDAVNGRRGSLICSATTSASGVAQCGGTTQQLGSSSGYEASFAGSSVYKPSTAKRRIASPATP
jgi:hypothetical protein